jgi:5-methyltetrahydropteroyltriglutamate--homocysteine methyltransferase
MPEPYERNCHPAEKLARYGLRRPQPEIGVAGLPATFEQLSKLRVDQVGSLVSPHVLRSLAKQHRLGEIGDDELRVGQDNAIREAVKRQEAICIPIVTDGEFRRQNFQESFSASVSGFEVFRDAEKTRDWQEPNRPLTRTEQKFDAPGPAVVTRRAATERLSLRHNIVLDEFRFCASVANNPVKVSLIGPDRIAQRFAWERSQAVYGDIDEFVADVVAIERQMIQQLVDAGCRYIHIDAPGFTAYVDPVSLERMRARGEDPERNLDRAIQAENAIIAGFKDVVFGLHICRGNPRGFDPKTGKIFAQWHREGHYEAIAERLFGALDHDRLLLEYDSDRAGGFAPLRFIRKDKIAVLGLVSTKTADLETKDDLRRRIDEASQYLPLDQLALSPQCGFSSGVEAAQIDEDEQWRKFETIIDTARVVWN